MNRWEAELRARYDQVEVPAPLRTMDANDERIAQQSDAFFLRLTRSFILSDLAIRTLVRIDDRMLVPLLR